MGKKQKAIKESNIKILSHPAITESGVSDVTFEVDGEVVEREFDVDVYIKFCEPCFCGCGHREAIEVHVTATCCNEEDEDIAGIMERKLEEAVGEITHWRPIN